MTQHTPVFNTGETLDTMPLVTVEQITRFRDAALKNAMELIKLTERNADLQFSLDKEVKRVMDLQKHRDVLLAAAKEAVRSGVLYPLSVVIKELENSSPTNEVTP